MNKIKPRFVYHAEHWRDGKLLSESVSPNLVTDEGLTYLADVALNAGTQITEFRVVPIESNHTPAAGNTYATPGYTECTAYDESVRPVWTEAGVTAKTITNSASKASFTFNSTKTIYAAALVGGGTDSTGAITAFADYSGTVAGTVKVTSAAHGLSNSDVVTISGSTNYNGTFAITVVDVDNFHITDTWVSDDAAGAWGFDASAQKGDTANGAKLISVSNFGSGNEKVMQDDDVLKIYITLEMTSS